jgi:hypothetical protein
VVTYAKRWPGKAYVYYLNEGNPWEGPEKGRTSHILDIAYFYQNFSEYLDSDQQAVSKAFASDFLKFCHGLAPWPAVDKTSFTARVFGPSSKQQISDISSQEYGGNTLRRGILLKHAAKVPLDDLVKVAGVFQSN